MKQPLQPPRYFCCGCCTSTKEDEPKDLEAGYEQESPSLAQIAINTALQYPSNRPSREEEPRPVHREERIEGEGEREGVEGGDVPPSYEAVMKTGTVRDEPQTMRTGQPALNSRDSKRSAEIGANESGNVGASGRREEQEEQELSEVESVRSWGTDSSFEGGGGAGRGEILTPPSTVFEGEGRERRRG